MATAPPLLGLDHFMLALERNDSSVGTSGHTCRYLLDLKGDFNIQNFKKTLKENEVAQWLSSLFISSSIISQKYWSIGTPKSIFVEEILTDERLPSKLSKTILHKEGNPLFYFSILRRTNKASTLVFSWHHLLMDGFGAVLFLENLVQPIERKSVQRKKSTLSLSILKECIKAKKFVDSTSKGEIETMENIFTSEVQQNFKFIQFTKEESKEIERNAQENGSRFGISSYFLACSSIIVAEHLINKNQHKIKDFWVPVPQDTRKKGSKWPITGNHLSFLFYRINKSYFSDKKEMTSDLNQQMLAQIKDKIPTAYSHLMNYMRNIPTGLYAKLIKGPNGESLSSFLFTVAAEHPKDLTKINGCRITNAISIPPNTYPPGLTFAYNRFDDKIQLVIPYYEHLFSEKEMAKIEKGIREELLCFEE